jgi:Na+/melibiose symporter-like transporter
MFVLALSDTWLGAIAAVCSIIGIAMTILSYVAGRRSAATQAANDCHERLLAEQRRTETLSTELHTLRMRQNEPWVPE